MQKKYDLVILPKAGLDMKSIFEYISVTLSNEAAALKLIGEFECALDGVCIMPLSCPKINNEYVKDKRLRKLIVNNYILFYRTDDAEKEIQVVRVLYGMMNYTEIL